MGYVFESFGLKLGFLFCVSLHGVTTGKAYHLVRISESAEIPTIYSNVLVIDGPAYVERRFRCSILKDEASECP